MFNSDGDSDTIGAVARGSVSAFEGRYGRGDFVCAGVHGCWAFERKPASAIDLTNRGESRASNVLHLLGTSVRDYANDSRVVRERYRNAVRSTRTRQRGQGPQVAFREERYFC